MPTLDVETAFYAFPLSISWEDFGYFGEWELRALLQEKGMSPWDNGQVMKLWREHPIQQPGKPSERMFHLQTM
jgi:hypothetical protein